MSNKTGTATLTDHLARWTSILFDSSVLSLFVFPIIGWQGDRWRGILWALIAIVLLSGIPLAYLVVGRRRGWVHDLEPSDRRDRSDHDDIHHRDPLSILRRADPSDNRQTARSRFLPGWTSTRENPSRS